MANKIKINTGTNVFYITGCNLVTGAIAVDTSPKKAHVFKDSEIDKAFQICTSSYKQYKVEKF